MANKNYSEKYYSKKIKALVFSTIIYIFLILLTILAFDMNQTIIRLGVFAWDFVIFSVIWGLLLMMLWKINVTRFQQSEAAWKSECSLPKEERNTSFLSKRIENTNIIIVVMCLVFLTILAIFASSMVSLGFYIPFAVAFVAMLGIEFLHSFRLKKLCARELLIHTEEHVIFWDEEIGAAVRVGILQLLWAVIVFLYLIAATPITPLGIVIILAGMLAILIEMLWRVISLRRLADNEAIENWKEKKEREKSWAQQREKANEKETKEGEGVTYSQKRLYAPELQYIDCASFKALSAEFVSYAGDCGLTVSNEDACAIFAGMAASHAVWLYNESITYAKKIALVLQAFFTGLADCISVPFTANNIGDLFRNEGKSGDKNALTLKDQLLIVKERTNSVNVIAFHALSYKDFEVVFAPFVTHFRAPQLKSKIPMRDIYGYDTSGSGLELQPNMWCIFVAESKKDMPKNSFEYASGVRLTYNDTKNAPISIKPRTIVLSYARFKELKMEAAQDYFLSLDMWKKLDKVEEYLYDVCKFSITNPLARQLETYSAVLLACSVPVMEVIDDMLANKIFPIIAHVDKEQLNQEGNSFAELLDGLFGMDNIPLSQKKLSENRWA